MEHRRWGNRILYRRILHLLVECHRPEMPKFASLIGKPRIEFRGINSSKCFHIAASVLLCIYACHTGNDSGKEQIDIILIYVCHKAILPFSPLAVLYCSIQKAMKYEMLSVAIFKWVYKYSAK